MDELNNPIPEQNNPPEPFPPRPPYVYEAPPRYVFPMGKRELFFAAGIILFSLLLCNSLIYAGANLGFAAGLASVLVSSFAYLRSHGHKADWYSGALLVLSLVLIAAFPRSSDDAMKFIMVCLLLVVPSLAFCLMAGQNRRDPATIASLLDSPRALFGLGMGRMTESFRGAKEACRSTGTVGKKGGAIVLGLVIAVPLLAVLVPLLMSADAAFEGLLDLLPEFRFDELLTTVLFGGLTACVLYSRGAALQHLIKSGPQPKQRKGLNALTVNTVLIAVAVVYGAYLISQLAYFVGGFAGILPEEYTLAQYARRGFFEMAWLCALNLGLMGISVGLVTARGKAPLSTRLLCLFLGIVTLFLVATASAKMFLYIGSYGLTRLRVTTEVFMLWLGLTTVFVCLWLFRPKLPYMKLTTVAGLVLLAVLVWADVDTVVARYNVRAWQSGKLETVDIWHLSNLNSAAVPFIEELVDDPDPEIAERAKNTLKNRYISRSDDLRGWNWANARALEILEKYRLPEAVEIVEH